MTKLDVVCDAISRRIETGELREGDRLPSEAQLAAGFRVSVGTVQKALARLSSGGLIRREHGRGTFVHRSRVTSDVNYLRFVDARGRELPNYVQVLSVRALDRAGPWSEFLGPTDGYVRIERSMDVGGAFDLYAEFWLRRGDFERVAATARQDLATNLRVLVTRELALPTLRVDQRIRFELLPRRAAVLLGLDPARAGFVMQMRGYGVNEHPVFYQRICAGPFAQDLTIVR